MAVWRLSGFTMLFMILSAFGLTISGLYYFEVIKQPQSVIPTTINVTVSFPHYFNYTMYDENGIQNETGEIHCGIAGFTFTALTTNGNVVTTFNFADPSFITTMENIDQGITSDQLALMLAFLSDSAYTNNGKNLTMELNCTTAYLMNLYFFVTLTQQNATLDPKSIMIELPVIASLATDINFANAMLGQQPITNATLVFPTPAEYNLQLQTMVFYANYTTNVIYSYNNQNYTIGLEQSSI